MMYATLILWLLGASTAHASLLSAPRLGRLRGGADIDLENDDDVAAAAVDDTPLTEEEVMAKLNQVPTFTVMGKEEGGFVALERREGGRAIAFFIEPEEAKAVLNMTHAAHPELELRLVCIGLGNAFKICKESEEGGEASAAFSEFDGHLRLQTSTQLAQTTEPKLKAMLAAAGMSEGAWQCPVFLCDQMSGGEMVPIFLHPREIRTAWLANDRKEADLPDKFVMLDIRMLVDDMQKPAKGLPWRKVLFVGAEGAAEFANQLQAAVPRPSS